jgi:hypothetical protein
MGTFKIDTIATTREKFLGLLFWVYYKWYQSESFCHSGMGYVNWNTLKFHPYRGMVFEIPL